MLNQYIQAPYIVFPFGLAKPALVVSIIYLCVLTLFLFHGTINSTFKLIFRCPSKLPKGEKNKIIISVAGYVVIVLSCITLPSFWDENNIILNISKVYLQYETLIYVGIFLFLCTAILNNVNRERHIATSNRILQFVIWISIGCGLLSEEICYDYGPNIVIIILAGILSFFILLFQIDPIITVSDKTHRFDMVPYTPVQKANELFPRHKMQAEEVANIIFNSSSDPFSICISGEWGKGKTSVVYGIMDLLKEKEECSYEFIHINALELDNKQSMMRYLFSQIKDKLESRGVYVGIDSEFKDFISSSAGTLTSNSIGAFIHKKFFQENDDYIFQKKKIEEVLQRAFNNGKLIVIVDDIERCDKKIAREYLFLIKEVATMKNCVSIFVTDYKVLHSLFKDESNVDDSSSTSDFLDKFFNCTIYLRDELPEDIFDFYDNYFKEADPTFHSIYQYVCMSPGTWYRTVVSSINSHLEEEKRQKEKVFYDDEKSKPYDEKIKKLEAHLLLFNCLIQNSRHVAKFYNVFRNNIIVCDKLIRSTTVETETKKYLDSRNIGQILYLLSFVEIFLPSEYQLFIERGAKYIEAPLYGKDDLVSEKRALLIEIADNMVYGKYTDFEKPNSYITANIRKFVETFLTHKNNLSQLVNGFSSLEEEWITAIDESNTPVIKANWTEMALMVLRKNPNIDLGITNEWRTQEFAKLLVFAEQQIEVGDWTSDKVFSLFDSKLKTDMLFSIGTGMLTIFWEHLKESTVYKKPSKDLVNEINMFPYHYLYDRMGYIYRLAHYLIPYGTDNEETKDLHEYMLVTDREYGENVSCLLDELVHCIPNYSLSSKTWDKKYKELAERIKEYLKQKNFAEYPEVKYEIELMMDSIEEFSSLIGILSWVQDADNESYVFPSDFSMDNIEEVIQYFERVFVSLHEDKEGEIAQQFLAFFKWMQNIQGLVIDEQQAGRLHELVTIYVRELGYSSMPYRRLLLSISENPNR